MVALALGLEHRHQTLIADEHVDEDDDGEGEQEPSDNRSRPPPFLGGERPALRARLIQLS
jgi:hypothetical protein